MFVIFYASAFLDGQKRGPAQHKFRSACLTEDARGRWYFCVAVDCESVQGRGTCSVGIDLGCKDAATVSAGEKLSGHWYREQQTLAVAQRAGKKKRFKAIPAKAGNRRKDALHKFGRKLVDENAAIFVGNVNAIAAIAIAIAKAKLTK